MTDVDEHALGIEVGDLQMTGFVDTQAGGIAAHEQGMKLGGGESREEGLQFVGMQDGGQASGPSFGEGEVCDVPGAFKGDGVEEFEGGVDLAVRIVGQFLHFDAVQEELSDLGFAEFGRRASEEGGELAAVEER